LLPMPYVNAGPYTIWYLEGGRGTPVVFIHDIGCNNWVWKDVYATNPPGAIYYLLDLPGHGGSSRSEFSIHGYAQSVIEFARYHEFDGMFLVGHHMGGAVALEAAKLGGRLVKGIVLINTPQRFTFPSYLLEALERDPEEAINHFTSLTLSQSAPEDLRTDIRLLMKHNGVGVFTSDIKACLGHGTLSLGGWRGPGLHILSDDERLFHRSQAFGEFGTVMLRGGGHYPMLESPQPLAEAINRFLVKRIKHRG